MAAGFAVAGDIEPVPGEPLAVVWRRQQFIDIPLEGMGARVGSNAGNVSWIGRQAG